MPKLVITNVGILAARAADEALRGLPADAATLKALQDGRGFAGQQEAERQQLQEWATQLALNEPKVLDRMPPEIKSLQKIGVSKDDRLVFYATETPQSIYAARLLAHFYQRRDCETEWQVITGLQSSDARRFSQGIQRYIESVTDCVQQWRYSYEIILNATSGFKSLIPYMTLIGALNGLTMQYIFETSPTLLSLPFVKLRFDDELFERYGEALFQRLDKETGIPCAEIERLSDFGALQPFLEAVDGEYILSPLGLIFYETYKGNLTIPMSKRKPEQKDGFREPKQEGHRRKEFELFRQKLAQHPYVDEFHYQGGCSEEKKQVRRPKGSDNLLHLDYVGITAAVSTTARPNTHDLDKIEQEMQELLNSLP